MRGIIPSRHPSIARPKFNIGDSVYAPIGGRAKLRMKVRYIYRDMDNVYLYKFVDEKKNTEYLIREDAL